MRTPSLSGHFASWKQFQYDSIFDIKKGSRLTKADMSGGATPFVGASDANNGVTAYVDSAPDHPANVITVSYNGSVAEAFYQPAPFCATDDVNILYPHFPIDQYSGLFIATVIRKEKYRFNYGRKWHKERMERSAISLPVNRKGEVDTKAMADYIRALNDNKTIESELKDAKKSASSHSVSLDTDSWRYYKLKELFDIYTGKDLIYNASSGTDYPVIGHGVADNGVACRTEKLDDYQLFDHSKTISLADRGNFFATIQAEDFYLGTRTKALVSKVSDISREALLFMCTIINREFFRFNYGRVASKRTHDLAIKLPTKDDEPDWAYMRAYIDSLPYSAKL